MTDSGSFLEVGDIVIVDHRDQIFPAIVVVPLGMHSENVGQWATIHVHLAGYSTNVEQQDRVVFPTITEARASKLHKPEYAYLKHTPVRELMEVLKDFFGGATSEYGGVTYELEKMLGEHTD